MLPYSAHKLGLIKEYHLSLHYSEKKGRPTVFLKEMRRSYPDIAWPEIISLRNRFYPRL
jgi:hypothetical protein